MQKPVSKQKRFPRKLATIVGLLLVVAIGLLIWHAHNNSNNDSQTAANKKPVSGSQNTKGEINTPSPSPGTSQTDSSKTGGATTTLLTPSGDFVSAHHVSLDTSLVSVCNTTVGATCEIDFTSGSQTLSLPAQTTDSGGSSYWNSWTPRSLSLTPGTWSIQAVAKINGQSKSASDALPLVVSQ